MRKRPTYPPNDKLVEFFHRHVVPVYFDMKRGADHRRFIITTFVMSIYEQWFLVTAGHCIENIEKLTEAGYKITRCWLIDSMGTGAAHRHPIPFENKGVRPLYNKT